MARLQRLGAVERCLEGLGLGLAVRPARVVQAQWLIEQVLDGARMRLPD
jgi:hypothetical protein